MQAANLSNFGTFLGQYEVRTPSGAVVTLTPEEEAEITKAAMEEQLRQEMIAPFALKQAAVESTLRAVGNIAGMAVGGYFLGRFLGFTVPR